MFLVIAALLLGCAVGMFGLLPVKIAGSMERLVNLTLFGMLFALGAQIGLNDEVFANLRLLGWQAAVIAILGIVGSIAALWLTCRLLKMKSGRAGEV